MITNQLHLKSAKGREVHPRQYQHTLFDWDAAEAMKVQEANKKTLEQAQTLFNIKVIISNLYILKDTLDLGRTLWVGVNSALLIFKWLGKYAGWW